MSERKSTILFIDASYYNFYRLTATIAWYKYSDERMATLHGKTEWLDIPEFMEAYERNWLSNITKIIKKFNATRVIYARDGKDVWRYKVFPEYKLHRAQTEEYTPFDGGPVFKWTNENLVEKIGGCTVNVVRIEEAEADDVIAIGIRYIRTVLEQSNDIVIITGDHDLLQIPNVRVYTANLKEITSQNPRTSLYKKVLSGDPSDNIKGIFKGCGKKTAEKLANDPELLEKTIIEKNCQAQFNLNKMLVDFEEIPEAIVHKIYGQFDNIF